MTKPDIDADGVAETESDHFMKCPVCSQWFDIRDLAQVVEHIHDNEIEVLEEPIPPPRGGPVHKAKVRQLNRRALPMDHAASFYESSPSTIPAGAPF